MQTSAVLQSTSTRPRGVLTPKTPAGVPAPEGALGIVLASPRQVPPEPTSKDRCKGGGWGDFPQFKNQGGCVSFVASRKPRPPG